MRINLKKLLNMKLMKTNKAISFNAFRKIGFYRFHYKNLMCFINFKFCFGCLWIKI